MQKVRLYKFTDYSTGASGWSLSEVWNHLTNTYSDPYEVEIPDEFSLGRTLSGDILLIKDGKDQPAMLELSDDGESPMIVAENGHIIMLLKARKLDPVKQMEFHIRVDKEIKDSFLWSGPYEFLVHDGRNFRIDFLKNEIQETGTLVRIIAKNLDLDTFPDADMLYPEDISAIGEFNCIPDMEGIHLVRLEMLKFITESGKVVKLPETMLNTADLKSVQ